MQGLLLSSPMAPAAFLLLSAFVLQLVLPRIDVRPPVRAFIAPGLVLVAGLLLIPINYTETPIAPIAPTFDLTEAITVFAFQADGLSLLFLLLSLITLLIGALLLDDTAYLARWLLLGGATGLLFVPSNSLTLMYSLLLVDGLLALHWFRREQPNLAVGRLFVSFLTLGALLLASFAPADAPFWAITVVGLALLSRVGILPLFEANAHQTMSLAEPLASRYRVEMLLFWLFSLMVAGYLITRMLLLPLPSLLHWLAMLLMLVNGLLIWLTDAEQRTEPIILMRLAATQMLLLLIIAPMIGPMMSAAYILGLLLSVSTLWLLPNLGPPTDVSRAWPYLSALLGTLTLASVPLFLMWPARVTAYTTLLVPGTLTVTILATLAEMFALSGLLYLWQARWRNEPTSDAVPLRAAIGFLAAIPFLLPGVGVLLITLLTGALFPPTEINSLLTAGGLVAVMVGGAVAVGWYRAEILAHLNGEPAALGEWLRLEWLLAWLNRQLDALGRGILRLNVIIEGQHYIGWVFFATLIGMLLLLLRA